MGKGSCFIGLFPYKKKLYEKFTAPGLSLQLATQDIGSKDKGLVEAETKETETKVTFTMPAWSATVRDKKGGKHDIVYTSELDTVIASGAKGTIKIENQHTEDGPEKDIVFGLDYA